MCVGGVLPVLQYQKQTSLTHSGVCADVRTMAESCLNEQHRYMGCWGITCRYQMKVIRYRDVRCEKTECRKRPTLNLLHMVFINE